MVPALVASSSQLSHDPHGVSPPGAVADGAGQRHPLLHEGAVAQRLDDGVAAHAGGAARIVDGAPHQRDGDVGIGPALVVAHQAQPPAGALEAAGAVQVGGGDAHHLAEAVVEQVLDADGAGPLGPEAARQGELAVVGDGGQVEVAGRGGAAKAVASSRVRRDRFTMTPSSCRSNSGVRPRTGATTISHTPSSAVTV